jgi:hypothetical protein
MKKLFALLACTACTLAAADTALTNVPPTLQKALHGSAIQSARLDAGVLRLQMDKPQVTELVYATFVFHNICAQQWRHPEQFAGYGLTRVELLNAGATQGFAFDARGDVCAEMGQMGKNFRSFIAQRTVSCDAGTCPARP